MDQNLQLSIVSPIYRAKATLRPLLEQIQESLESKSLSFEVILVEDGCPENSWDLIKALKPEFPFVRAFKLSRNFGQHYAITAGLKYASAEHVVVMDCDLQDDPKFIPELLKELESTESDLILARRMNRKDGLLKKLTSFAFHSLLSFLSGMKLDPRIGNFGVYKRRVIEAVLDMGDKIRYFPAMILWVGFKKTYLNIEHQARYEGRSSYNFKKLFALATDIILSYSDKPIRLVVGFGLVSSILSFLVMLVYFILALLGYFEVSGFASIMVSVWFLGAVIILSLGVMGMYIGKSFEAVKRRPVFIIEDEI